MTFHNAFSLWLLIGLFPLIPTSLRAAAPGELDETFATGGVLTLRVAPLGSTEGAHDATVLRDGRIVIGGHWNNSYSLARLQADGTLDATFGSGGTSFPASGEVIELGLFGGVAMALQLDGRIIDGGAYFAAIRHDTNGIRDMSFGSGGKAVFPWPYAAGANDMLVQPDDKIVFGGYVQTIGGQEARQDIAFVRYNADGTPDWAFGNAGSVVTDLGGQIDRCMRVALQRDGKIVAACYSGELSPTNVWWLVRYAPDGTLDATFGLSGKVLAFNARPSVGEYPYAVAVQTDGRILLGGTHTNRFVLLRFNADGSPDTSFGTNGKVLTQAGSRSSSCRAIAVQANGKILAAGHADSSFAFARYQPDGTLDATFGGDGVVTNAVGYANHIALQQDGKILLTGQSLAVHNYGDFGVLRYHGDPIIVEPPVITVQPTNQTVAVGATVTLTVEATGTPPLDYAWRFNGTGIPDATNPVLPLASVTLANEGRYSVIVINEFGSAISSNAFLNVNRTPVANAQGTRTVVISGNNSHAIMSLDGTRSFDADGDPLIYSWFREGSAQPIATGAVAAVQLPLGIQTLELKVSDGFAEQTAFVTIEVITFSEALQRLSDEVKASNLGRGRQHQLRVPLARARRFFEQNRVTRGVVRLERFQRRVLRLVEPQSPELASAWLAQAQAVIDAMLPEPPQPVLRKE